MLLWQKDCQARPTGFDKSLTLLTKQMYSWAQPFYIQVWYIASQNYIQWDVNNLGLTELNNASLLNCFSEVECANVCFWISPKKMKLKMSLMLFGNTNLFLWNGHGGTQFEKYECTEYTLWARNKNVWKIH